MIRSKSFIKTGVRDKNIQANLGPAFHVIHFFRKKKILKTTTQKISTIFFLHLMCIDRVQFFKNTSFVNNNFIKQVNIIFITKIGGM